MRFIWDQIKPLLLVVTVFVFDSRVILNETRRSDQILYTFTDCVPSTRFFRVRLGVSSFPRWRVADLFTYDNNNSNIKTNDGDDNGGTAFSSAATPALSIMAGKPGQVNHTCACTRQPRCYLNIIIIIILTARDDRHDNA